MTIKRARSWACFRRRYKPIPLGDGTILRGWANIRLQTDERYIWTMIEGDQSPRNYLVPGYHTVNYLGRVLCAEPWADEELEAQPYVAPRTL